MSEIPSYSYKCGVCGLEDFEVRKAENMDDPLGCPTCAGEMKRFIGEGTGAYVRIKDSKLFMGKTHKRTRVLGTMCGRIRPQDITAEALEKAARTEKD